MHRRRAFWILAALWSLLAAVCVLKILSPNQSYRFEGGFAFPEGTPTEDTVIYEGISLSPGVYFIELEYTSDTDLAALCSLKDGTVFTGGLLTNGEHIYGGLDRTGYHAWLYEGTDNLQVVVSYGGKGTLETGGLTIRETDRLWTMALVLLAFAGTAGMLCMLYYYYDKEYRVPFRKKQAFFFVALISLLASIPCLYGSVLGGADLTYHLQRIEGVKDGLLGGQFPVRLEPEWLYGHGYADAVFYCNALLYLPALLRLAGFTVTDSYNVYCIVINIATAWIAWYCFSRIFKNDGVGFVCSGLYTLSFFRLFKLYGAGAVGEGSAYTFLPLVLYGMYRVFTQDPRDKEYKTAWVPVALGYGGLIQTHVLTCEITAFLTILVCLAGIRKIFRRNTFLELAKGAGAALGASLWYLVPFLDYYLTQDMHIKHVSARTIQERGLSFPQLAFSFWRESRDVWPEGIGLVLLLGLLAFPVVCILGGLQGRGGVSGEAASHKQSSARLAPVKLSFFCALLGGLLLVMSLRVFPWDRIQGLNGVAASLVSSLQFPNRFLGWGTACLVTVFGFCLWVLYEKRRKLYWLGVGTAVAAGILSGIFYTNYMMKNQTSLWLYNEEGMGFGYISGAEYLIQGTQESLLTFQGAEAGEGVGIWSYTKEYLQVEMDCVNEGVGEGYVDLPLLLYKGYRAHETGTGRELSVCDGENHRVRVILPEGFSGKVSVGFASPFYWRVGEVCSVLTVALFVGLWCVRRRKRDE